MPRLLHLSALLLVLAACSYDGSGLASVGLPTTTTTGTTTAAATTGVTDSTTTAPTTTGVTSTGTTTPVDPTEAPGTTSTSTTDPGTTTSTTGTTDPSSTSSTTTTGTTDPDTTSTTGDPPPLELIDDGLVVRYFLDEAMNGQGPAAALDAAPDPLPLPLAYSNMGGMNPVYSAVGENRGLRWPAAGLDGRATIALGGTKIQTRLDQKIAATVELVLKVDGVIAGGSRISHAGASAESGHFSVRSSDINRLDFYSNNTLAGAWPVDWLALGRTVVHVVFNSAQADPIHRVRLYIDGQPVSDGVDLGVVDPPQNAQLSLPTTSNGQPLHYTLGNRGVSLDRSFHGVLLYAAIYDEALSEPELQHNASILEVSDDTP